MKQMDSTRMRRKKRKQRTSLLTNIVFCVMTLAALTACLLLVLQNYTLKNEGAQVVAQFEEYEQQHQNYLYTQLDLSSYADRAAAQARDEERSLVMEELKQGILDADSATDAFRKFFPNDVVVYADSAYHFFPISDTLKKHTYVYDNFKLRDDGQVEYVNDRDEVISAKGIDVSRYQGNINWSRVAADGVEYAFIRAGLRGSTEGNLAEDQRFEANIKGALDNDIAVGVYFFSQAVTEAEAVEEANMVLDLIEPYEVTYPIVIDIEEVTSENARTKDLTQEEYTKNCIAFCETIKNAGYTPMIYGNLKSFMIMLDMEQLEDYEKWFAYYNDPVYFPYQFSVWQYTSEGSVEGISADVDMNVCMKDFK